MRLRAPPDGLLRQVCTFVQELRWLDLYRVPGVGETLDWARCLDELGREEVDAQTADRTLGSLLKGRDDLERVRQANALEELAERARARDGDADAAA